MKRKIFISLDIPERDRKRLARLAEKWHDLPVKWTRANNLHITLAFLGFIMETDLPEICQKVAVAAQKNTIFDLEFDEISLFPSVEEPQAIALIGRPSTELKNLVNDLEDALGIAYAPRKSFRPHLTLGRIRKNKWAEMEEEPRILEKFRVNLPVDAIEIMASDFDGETGEYAVLESCPLS